MTHLSSRDIQALFLPDSIYDLIIGNISLTRPADKPGPMWTVALCKAQTDENYNKEKEDNKKEDNKKVDNKKEDNKNELTKKKTSWKQMILTKNIICAR